jgi:alpha-glucosidase (family GH31 glycosyl hydrolase)
MEYRLMWMSWLIFADVHLIHLVQSMEQLLMIWQVVICKCHDEGNHIKYDECGLKINRAVLYEGLGYRTAPMMVKHYDGTFEYDAHDLYGLAESIVINKAMTMVCNKRPFILSQSTIIGTGCTLYRRQWN